MELTTTHAAAALLAALGVGWAGGRLNELRHRRHVEGMLRREREEAEKAMAALRREIGDANARRDDQTAVFQGLPDVLDEMFRAPSRRAVYPVLVKLVETLLRPEQATVFAARSAQRLALAEGVGLTAHLKAGVEVAYGQGRVGYVAETRVAMDDADLRRADARRKGADGRAAPELKDLRADAAAPVLDGENVLAVVTVGGARQRRGLEKRLLSMAASLAAAAATAADARAAAAGGAEGDGMTGLLSRRSLEQRLEAELQRAERDKTPVSVLLVDVDELRHYNQTNGAQQGDELLRRLAGLLKASVRAEDLVARFGGEEMVVVFPGADKETALRLSENIRRAVEEYPFPMRGLQPAGKVTVSGGVATCPGDARGGRELLSCADEAMLGAKRGGRNRIHPAKPSYLS